MSILKVTIQEQLTLNGIDRTNEYTRTIENITEADDRMMSVGTSETDLVKFELTPGAGQFVNSSVQYIRITHLPPASAGSNVLTLRVSCDRDDKEYFVKLDEGASFTLSNTNTDVNEGDSSYGGSFSLSNIDRISAVGTATVDVSVFVSTS